MVRIPIILLALACLASCNTRLKSDDLRKEIIARLNTAEGRFAVAFYDLQTDEVILVNEHERFHAASTMKTPVMVEVYRQVSAEKFSLQDSIPIINEFKSIVDESVYSLDSTEDSELELYRNIGKKKSMYDVMYAMIIYSSNLATNLIIDKVGAKNVTATMRSMGLKDLEVLRGVEDDKAYRKGLNNTVTAYDLMLLLSKIAKGEAVNREASDGMIRILLDQKFNDIIPAKLPDGVKVAHKTGWITGLHHDSGIVFLPDGRSYVLVLLSSELADEKAGVEAMAEVSRMIYDGVVAQGKGQ